MARGAFAAVAFGAMLAACAPPPPRGPDVQLYVFDCGHISVSDAGVFADDGAYNGQARELVDPCFLIRHPDGDLLWDAGLPDALAEIEGGVTEGAFTVSVTTGLAAQLTQLGLTPEDIEYVSFSHGHLDHVGNANLFAHAIWIADAEEREWMFREEARAGRDFAYYSGLESARVRLIEDEEPFDVFEDGSVQVTPAPGHTPGHTVLLVRLNRAGPVLLTGDLWHMAESREARRVPVFNIDRAQTLASMDKVEALAAETGARVVRQHVAEDIAALPALPQPLD